MTLLPLLSRKACTLSSLALSMALTGIASAQEREWVSFDDSPAGTPPTVNLLTANCNPEKALFDVKIHGLWLENRTDPNTGETFKAVLLPDSSSSTDAYGWPELPSIPLNLAIPTRDANYGFDTNVLERVVLENIHVAPAQPKEAEDRDGDSDQNVFYYDQGFYQQTSSPWPEGDARPIGQTHSNHGIPTQAVTMQCVRSVPAAKQLVVDTRFQFTASFAGNPIEPFEMNRRFAARFDLQYHNAPMWWQLQLARLNAGANEGCYLIVTAQKYVNELMPLIEQKTERGLRVTVVTTESLGSGFDHTDVKSAINDWYGDCDSIFEAYVLLVGDVDEMPMHIDPVNELPSDHYYVCLEDELFPSCEIGRFSVDSEEDLEEQISKTMKYSESPLLVSGHYERSLLAAHKQESKYYVECIEDIATASYWGYNPTFKLFSGREADSLVSNVLDEINETHYGLVMYRGHGWKLKWGDNWNMYNEELWDTDVAGLTNGRYTPIVVAVACGNNAIDMEDDSISEKWMEGSENGAVAHIGSIRSSKTTPNHEFAKAFQHYYWCGYSLCASEMMQDAWITARMNVSNQSSAEKNIYMSQLLGDPELRPRQQAPWHIVFKDVPDWFHPGINEVSLQLELDRTEDPTDILVSVTINDEPVSLARVAEDGTINLQLDVPADAKVVIRGFSELGSGVDGRYEIPVGHDDCPADLDGDGEVEVDDLLLIISSWDSPNADITGDGTTNIDDLLEALAGFGLCS
ncbi:MAG: C25 family cysteine peptidase [Phycisphaerales bacterium]|nr:C25 family cysteine peptidase [Phycisphaerales bacterium]